MGLEDEYSKKYRGAKTLQQNMQANAMILISKNGIQHESELRIGLEMANGFEYMGIVTY